MVNTELNTLLDDYLLYCFIPTRYYIPCFCSFGTREAIEELVIDLNSCICCCIYNIRYIVATILLKINQRFSIIRGWNLNVPGI